MRLSSVLSDPERLEAFRSFLRQEFADEGVAFFLAVEEYKAFASPLALERRKLSEAIFAAYVDPQADRQVNLPSGVVKRLQERRQAQDTSASLFDEAQAEVVATLRAGTFSRFLESCWFSGMARGGLYRQQFLDPMVVKSFGELCTSDSQWKRKKTVRGVERLSCRGKGEEEFILKARTVIGASAERIAQVCYDWNLRSSFDDHFHSFQELEKVDDSLRIVRLHYRAALARERGAVVGQLRCGKGQNGVQTVLVRSVPWGEDSEDDGSSKSPRPNQEGTKSPRPTAAAGKIEFTIECSGFYIEPLSENEARVTYVVQAHVGGRISKLLQAQVKKKRFVLLENLKKYIAT